MSDERLRELERALVKEPTPEVRVRLWTEQLRRGAIPTVRFAEVAAGSFMRLQADGDVGLYMKLAAPPGRALRLSDQRVFPIAANAPCCVTGSWARVEP